MFSQLEVMMSAVRQESAALDSMKAKVREFEELKTQLPILKKQLNDSEKAHAEALRLKNESDEQAAQLRLDMQRLNDMYNNERKQHLDAKHLQLRQEQELNRVLKDNIQLKKAADDMADVQKSNQSLTKQVNVLQARLDEEKRELERSLQMAEKQHEEAEKIKAELSQHFWNLSEELKQKQTALSESEECCRELEQTAANLRQGLGLASELALMCTEDKLSSSRETEERCMSRMSGLLSDVSTGKATIKRLEETIASLEDAMSGSGELAEKQRQESLEIIARQADQLQAMSDRNKELLDREVQLCRKIEAMGEEVKLAGAEGEKQKEEVSRRDEKIAALQKEVKAMAEARDEADVKLQSSITHATALEEQLRAAHDKQWVDVQQLKERELSVESQVKELQETIEEKESRITELEQEKDKIQEMCQEEVSKVSHMSGVLKAELEKRLDELSACSKERDALRAESTKMQRTIEEMNMELKKKEKIFQHAIDTDRAKIQQEMKSKNNRIRSLESEKQELLAETSHLMEQLASEQRAKSMVEKNVNTINTSLVNATEEAKELRAENSRLEKQLEESAKREKELTTRLSDGETQFKLDISRLDGIVKESRKTAAHQVGELSARNQALTDELAAERQRLSDLEASEKQAVLNAEKWATELKLLRTEHEEFQLSAGKEIATAKREAQHMGGKVKTLLDLKSKIEMELVSLRMERARAGSDVTHLNDRVKDLEEKCKSLESDLAKSTADLEAMTSQCRKNKASAIDFESNLQRHMKLLAKANEEIERLEKHSFLESKKLRSNLSNANRQLNENKETISRLSAEVESSSANYTKLQNTSNDTISGLIEELKRTEDALSKERQGNSQEMNRAHQKITELQSRLEATKESMQEKLYQTQTDKSDKEVMLSQLNAEIVRLKNSNESKDSRISDLEKQHQEDRSKAQDLRATIAKLENELSDLKVELAKTDKMKRALDVKLQRQLSSPSKRFDESWGSPHAATQSSVYQDETENDFDSSNRMYIGGGDEYLESKYGTSVYGEYDDGGDGDGEIGAGMGMYGGQYSGDNHNDSYKDTYAASHSFHAGDDDPIPQKMSPIQSFRPSPISHSVSQPPPCSPGDDVVDEEEFARTIAAAGSNRPTYGRPNQGNESVTSESGSNAVADSIARTQKFLKVRGGGGGSSRNQSGQVNRGTGGQTSRDVGSRGGGRKVEGATYLHDDGEEDFAFDAPSLMPATPPNISFDNNGIDDQHDDGGYHDADGVDSARTDSAPSREKSFSAPGISQAESTTREKNSSKSKSKKTRKVKSSSGVPRDNSLKSAQPEHRASEPLFPRISPLRKGSGGG